MTLSLPNDIDLKKIETDLDTLQNYARKYLSELCEGANVQRHNVFLARKSWSEFFTREFFPYIEGQIDEFLGDPVSEQKELINVYFLSTLIEQTELPQDLDESIAEELNTIHQGLYNPIALIRNIIPDFNSLTNKLIINNFEITEITKVIVKIRILKYIVDNFAKVKNYHDNHPDEIEQHYKEKLTEIYGDWLFKQLQDINDVAQTPDEYVKTTGYRIATMAAPKSTRDGVKPNLTSIPAAKIRPPKPAQSAEPSQNVDPQPQGRRFFSGFGDLPLDFDSDFGVFRNRPPNRSSNGLSNRPSNRSPAPIPTNAIPIDEIPSPPDVEDTAPSAWDQLLAAERNTSYRQRFGFTRARNPNPPVDPAPHGSFLMRQVYRFLFWINLSIAWDNVKIFPRATQIITDDAFDFIKSRRPFSFIFSLIAKFMVFALILLNLPLLVLGPVILGLTSLPFIMIESLIRSLPIRNRLKNAFLALPLYLDALKDIAFAIGGAFLWSNLLGIGLTLAGQVVGATALTSLLAIPFVPLLVASTAAISLTLPFIALTLTAKTLHNLVGFFFRPRYHFNFVQQTPVGHGLAAQLNQTLESTPLQNAEIGSTPAQTLRFASTSERDEINSSVDNAVNSLRRRTSRLR